MSVHRWARTRFAAGVIALTAITAVFWLVLWAAVVPLVRGWSPVAVVSGSMAPLIDSGDIVVAAPYDGEALDPGAVIVFDNPTGTGSMTHRVVDVTPAGEYVTRGDANGHIDSTPVPPDTIQGVGRILVPAIATPFVWANNSQWTHLIAAAIAVLAALWASRWALLARHNPWTHRPPPPVDNSITTIGALLGIWPTTPQPAAVAQPDTPDPPTPSPTRPGRGGPQRLAFTAIALAAVGSAVLVAPNLIESQAAFTNAPDNTGNSWIADTLDPPSGLTAVTNGNDIDLDWTATTDTYADGYNIYRGTTPGCCYTYIDSVVGRLTTNYTDSVPGGCCGGPPAFETVTTKSQTPATSMILDVPTGTAQDDLLIAHISVKRGDPSFATPSGWTLLFSTEVGGPGDVGVGVFYRIAGSSEPTNYTFTWTANRQSAGAMARYSNVDPTTPIDVWATATGNGSNPVSPDVTTTNANTMVIRLFGSDNDETVTNPPATTSRYDISGTGATAAAADATQPAAGATGTATFTLGSNEKWVAATIAIQPGAGAGPVTYYHVARAYHLNWESPNSNETTATVP